MPVKKISKPAAKKSSKKAAKKPVSAKKPVESKTKQSKETKCCSLCNKNAARSKSLIEGPNDTFICGECIEVCMKTLHEEDSSYACPIITQKTSKTMESLGSESRISPNQRIRAKYDILYLAPKNSLSDKIFTSHILPTAEKQKLKIKHLSEVLNSKTTFDKEILDIYNASLIIADIHNQDPNIMYFLGMNNLIGKPLILLLQNSEDIPKGLYKERYIIYKNVDKSLSDITTQIQPVFLAIKKIKKLTK